MRHNDTVRLYQYWNELRAGRPAPDRSEISPAALAGLLPSVMLLDRDRDGGASFRIAGSRLCALKGREMRGEPVAMLFVPADRRKVSKIVDSITRDRTIAVLETEARATGGRTITIEIALFPLEDDKTNVLGIASPSSTPVWLGTQPVELDLLGIRFVNPDSGLVFLQNRPSVPLGSQKANPGSRPIRKLSVIPKTGDEATPRAGPVFRVLDGGKK